MEWCQVDDQPPLFRWLLTESGEIEVKNFYQRCHVRRHSLIKCTCQQVSGIKNNSAEKTEMSQFAMPTTNNTVCLALVSLKQRQYCEWYDVMMCCGLFRGQSFPLFQAPTEDHRIES